MPNLRFFSDSPSSALSFLISPVGAFAQQGSIEKVEIRGNTVVDSETYLFHLTQKPGDPYDSKQAIADFHRLWATGFLDDLTLEVTDGERGKIVAYVVDERPRVQALDFVGSKELSASSITEKLTEEKAEIPVDSFYDPAKVVKAEKIIRTMLVDKGRTEGSVSSRVEPLDSGGVKVISTSRTSRRSASAPWISTGSANFDDWQSSWAMKKTRESHVLGALMGGSTYTEEQYAQDVEKVREVYLNHGYVDVRRSDRRRWRTRTATRASCSGSARKRWLN